MTLTILFGQRKERYSGEHGPEVLVCWDEFTIEENPEGFKDRCDELQKDLGDEFRAFRLIDIEVDQERINKLLNHRPVLKGAVAEGTRETIREDGCQ